MLEVFSLLVGISLLWNTGLCQSVDHHCYCVMPTSGIVDNITNPCYNSCHPLMYYANLKDDFEDNSTFYFLPGIHLMNGSVMSIANVTNITLGGYSNSSGDSACGFPGSMPVATVECEEDAGFYFRYIKNLSIVGIKINNCGYVSGQGKYVNAIMFHLIWDLCVNGLEVHDTEGVGIYGYEVVGNSIISNSLIDNSTPNGSNYTSGNIHFYYEYKSKKKYSHSLSIINSNITNGNNTRYQPSHRPHAGGMFIYLKTTNAIQILLENMTLSGNTGYNGGNVALDYITVGDSWPSNITIRNCKFLNASARGFGAGLYTAFIALYSSTYSGGHISKSTEVLRVIDSKFENNEALNVGAGTYIQLHENQHFNTVANISFTNCYFKNNSIRSKTDGRGGSAVNIINFRIPDYIPHPLAQYRISFSSCNFTENDARKITNDLIGSGAFYVEENAITILTDCRFDNNDCTGLSAVHSNLLLHGDIIISNNTAVNGGGIVLCANSIMYLSDNVNVTISDNNATRYGGGIYAEFECSQAIPPCFFQVNSTVVHLNESVFLQDNRAEAGSALYGGSIDNCYYYGPYNNASRSVFNDLFEIKTLPNDSSNITSNPLRVCFCEDDLTVNCNKSSVPHKVYSGAEVTITAVVVGQRDGPVPGIVIAQLSDTQNNDVYKLDHLQNSQIINSTNCTNLSYTVYSNTSGGNETITLSVQDSDFRSFSRRQPRTVDIELEVMPCPPGFSLKFSEMSQPTCKCMDEIQRLKNIVCNITKLSIFRHKYANWWIGFGNYSEDLDKEVPVMYCKFCPFDFCVNSYVVRIRTTKPESQDSQCANNRTGTLCGACKSGKSNVLGSSRCIDCNERTIVEFLLLILLFAVLGVILILFLGIFNLTVSEGTLNAIIFYMNVVRVNTTIFFPKQDTCIVTSWLEVFVAWMNLDLGIEMCFYNGMGAVGKTALHFVFPFYLWFLAGLIIYFSKKSSSITKLLGKNTIKVLATLILYSYAKLLRTIIDIWNVSDIYSSNSPPSSVWAMDGNISYFHDRRHSILFGFAVIVAAITLPYTFALLCIQRLRRMPKMKIFFWVNKFKPFFDAYTGPYKDQYHFWTGFLLLVRIFLFVAIVTNTTNGHIFHLVLIIGTASLLFLLIQSGIYKMWILNKCEAFAFFNLIIFAALTTYDMTYAYRNDIPAILCVGSMFLLFCGVVIYHVYKIFSDTQWWGKMKVWLLDKRWPWMKRKPIRSLILNHSGVDELSSSDSELDPILANAPPVVRYDEYREPLIETGEGT